MVGRSMVGADKPTELWRPPEGGMFALSTLRYKWVQFN